MFSCVDASLRCCDYLLWPERERDIKDMNKAKMLECNETKSKWLWWNGASGFKRKFDPLWEHCDFEWFWATIFNAKRESQWYCWLIHSFHFIHSFKACFFCVCKPCSVWEFGFSMGRICTKKSCAVFHCVVRVMKTQNMKSHEQLTK